MTRNLSRRVEAAAPIEDPHIFIEDPHIFKELQEMLGIFLADNRQGWDLQPDGSYIQRHPGENGIEKSAQALFMEKAIASLES
ncbi:MAG: hypothetical protein RLZZ148_1109 [Cyanobacteriota bacterium]